MNVGSLFSGIGGLDLGLERSGMTVIWQSEIDPYASKVLAKHWPTVPNLGDITLIDWSTIERPDLICGGYPCQPFSLAGGRAGADDPRHLWPHFHRAIRHLRPRYALLENVPGHLSMGFDTVLGDLAEIGYDTEWCSIPAAAVGAPHLRWRLFCVASDTERDELRQQPEPIFGRGSTTVAGDDGEARDVADTEVVSAGPGLRQDGPGGVGRRRSGDSGGAVDVADTAGGGLLGASLDDREDAAARPERSGKPERHGGQIERESGEGSPPMADTHDTRPQGRDQPWQRPSERDARSGSWTRPDHWLVEPDVGRVAHGVPNRVDRLRCLGNAVVPQVAEWIGRQIMEAAA